MYFKLTPVCFFSAKAKMSSTSSLLRKQVGGGRMRSRCISTPASPPRSRRGRAAAAAGACARCRSWAANQGANHSYHRERGLRCSARRCQRAATPPYPAPRAARAPPACPAPAPPPWPLPRPHDAGAAPAPAGLRQAHALGRGHLPQSHRQPGRHGREALGGFLGCYRRCCCCHRWHRGRREAGRVTKLRWVAGVRRPLGRLFHGVYVAREGRPAVPRLLIIATPLCAGAESACDTACTSRRRIARDRVCWYLRLL